MSSGISQRLSCYLNTHAPTAIVRTAGMAVWGE